MALTKHAQLIDDLTIAATRNPKLNAANSNLEIYDIQGNLLATIFSGAPSAAAGGANTQVQYNQGGALAGNAALTFDPATTQLTVPGLTVTQDQAWTGVITPAALTADVDNWAPAGAATASIIRASGNAANRAITGLDGGTDSRIVVLANVGTSVLALRNQSTSSTAGNRFAFGADMRLPGGSSILLRYDATATRWTPVGSPLTRSTIVSVRDFGAVGDGATDDTAAIQAAIDSLLTTGGMVWFPEGTYAVSSPIQVQTNGVLLFGAGISDMLATAAGSTVTTGRGSIIRATASWAGAGATAAMVRFTSTVGDGRPLLAGGMTGLHVCGWRFSTTAPAGTVNGIYARVARGVFDNIMASECSGRGMWVEGASTGNGDTVNWDCYDTIISRSQFAWNALDGFYASEFGGNDLHLDHVITFNNSLSGLRLRGSSAQVSSLHSYDNLFHGVHVENVRTWITNAKIEGNGRHGLYAQSVAANGRFWGGLNVNGVGFRGNSASAANTYDQMILEADGGDGPWIVNGCRFSGEQNTPRYGLNISSANPNQGIVSGNTFAGTFGTGPFNRNGPTSLGFMNRIMANKGIETLEDPILWPVEITPPAITADQNDYQPAGIEYAQVLRLSSNAPFRAINGIAFGMQGRHLILENVGVNVIQLRREAAGSSATARFSLPSDLRIEPSTSVMVRYDSTLTRWVVAHTVFPDPIDPGAPWELVDDFLQTGTETGETGALGWGFTNGSIAALAASQNAPGVIRRTSGATANQVASMFLNSSASAASFRFGEFDEMFWRVSLPTTGADFAVRFGIMDNYTSNPGVHGLYIERLATDVGWFGVSRNGSAGTRTAQLLAQDVNVFHTFRIRRVSATAVQFQVDRGAAVDLTATIPDAADSMTFGLQVIPTTTTARTLDIDFFSARGLPLSARW